MRNTWAALLLTIGLSVLIPTFARANSGDFNGGVAIGTSYAGVDTAPTNGLIVQGNVGIGNTAPGALLDIGASGITLGTLRLDGNTSGYVQLQSAASAGSWSMTLPTSAGANGYILQTDGSGNTSWVAPSGSPFPPGGRLTLSSSLPIMNSDITAATTLYYLPYQGELLPLYNGTTWQEYDFGSPGLSLALDDISVHTGYQAAGSLFDVVAINTGGTLTLCTGPAWTNSTTRANSLKRVNGILVNSGTWTLKCDATSSTYSASDSQATWLGTIGYPSTSSTLSALTSTATLATVASTNGWPSEAFYAVVGSEVIEVTGGFGTTSWTISRGQRGTTAAAHSSGASVSLDNGQAFWQIAPGKSIPLGSNNILSLYNGYNRKYVCSIEADANTAYTYSTATYAPRDGSTNINNRITAVFGQADDSIMMGMHDWPATSSIANAASDGIDIDSTTLVPAFIGGSIAATSTTANNYGTAEATTNSPPLLGMHYFQSMVYCSAGTCTWEPFTTEYYYMQICTNI